MVPRRAEQPDQSDVILETGRPAPSETHFRAARYTDSDVVLLTDTAR
jgi:hypothetical protein